MTGTDRLTNSWKILRGVLREQAARYLSWCRDLGFLLEDAVTSELTGDTVWKQGEAT